MNFKAKGNDTFATNEIYILMMSVVCNSYNADRGAMYNSCSLSSLYTSAFNTL